MSKHLSSAKSAKDKNTVNLDELALAMHADATFMSDEDYAAAQARLAKREAIMQPYKPLRPTKFGMFVAGLCAGAIIAGLTAFVMSISGVFAGVALAIGTAIILAVAGVQLGADE
jgi:hypothetical protein